jgi:hypothetical protein
MTNEIITQTHICRQFPTAKCSDESYTCPTEAWVESVFRAYKTLMKWLKVLSWRKHHDCDDKAGGFRWLCGVKWGMPQSQKTQGVAVGEVWYRTDQGGRHAINVVFLDAFTIRFVEPQGPKWVALSTAERDSVYFARF